MKKIICIILTIINVLSFAVYAENNETTLYENEFSQLAAYNIMVGLDSESMNKEVTQMQFREALMGVVGDNEALMNKIDSFGEVFDANGSVTLTKALISLVKLVGYDDNAIQKGGTFNEGYLDIASNIGILKGLPAIAENKNITYAQAGKLIYNTLNVPLMEVSFENGGIYYKENKDKTIMSEYMSIYEVKGIVNATSEFARIGYKTTADNKIIIGDSEYTISSLVMNSYFGMEVVAQYRYDEDNEESKILRIVPRYEDSTIELIPADITEYSDGKYTYIKEDMRKSKTLTIETGAVWFYNYKQVTTKEQADNMRYIPVVGSVKLIDSDHNSQYDIVMIYDYDVRIVDYVREETIYTLNNAGKVQVGTDTKIMDVNQNPIDGAMSVPEKSVVHVIFDDDGVYAKNILVTSNSIEGTVAGISKSDREIKLKNDEVYTVTEQNIAYLDEIKSGINITLYLDCNLNVAGYKPGVTGDYNIGYMIDIRLVDSDETGEPIVRVKLYDIAQKSIVNFHTTEKFKIDEEKYTPSRYSDINELFRSSDGKVYDQIIRYKLDKNEQIIEIDTAYDGDGNYDPYGIWGFFPAKKSGLVKVAGSQLLKETGQTASQTGTLPEEWERARQPYWVSSQAMNKLYILHDSKTGEKLVHTYVSNLTVDGNATVLYVPKNRNSVGEYFVTTRSAWNKNGNVVLDAYRVENETTIPTLIVAYEGNGVAEDGEVVSDVNNIELIKEDARPSLVVDLEYIWLEDIDDAGYRVKLLQSGQEKEYYIRNAGWVESLEYQVKNSSYLMGTVKGLHPGDIIKFAESGGFITAIDMYAPKSMIKNYNMNKWNKLSRGIMSFGGYIGYAYARFDDAIMAIQAPGKCSSSQKIDFNGDDIFMVSGMTIFEYDAKRKKVEKSGIDCIDYYTGTQKLEDTSVIVMFGDGGNFKDNCIYVLNNLFE